MTKAKIAVAHPMLGFGGSEHVCLSILQSLQEDLSVTLISGGFQNKINIGQLNEFCGTSVDAGKIAQLEVPFPRALRTRFSGLRGAYFQRRCRSLAGHFDLMLSSYGLMDFGVPGIQFVHDPSFNAVHLRELRQGCSGAREVFYRNSPVRAAYARICQLVSGGVTRVWSENLILANSKWTAARVENLLGVKPVVVYPPVRNGFRQVPWEQREDGFLCVGRWTPEKRMERVVEILAAIRGKGFPVKLHLVGNGGEPSYKRQLAQLQARNSEWMAIHDGIGSAEKAALFSSQRYGISGRPNEPFGIAVAEMVKAGCITFVPNGGGQIETVNHPALLFENEDDAVCKIGAVLSNDLLRQHLHRHLSRQALNFSTEKFQTTFRGIVRDFLGEKQAAARVALPLCPLWT